MAGIGIGISPYMSALRSKGEAPADTTLTVTPLSNTSLGLAWTLPVGVNVGKVEVWERGFGRGGV